MTKLPRYPSAKASPPPAPSWSWSPSMTRAAIPPMIAGMAAIRLSSSEAPTRIGQPASCPGGA